MSGHTTHLPHGSGIRGLRDASHIKGPDDVSGRFGRMFPRLRPLELPEDDLFNLATAMRAKDPPKDGPDKEESDFASAYTYFGQFIDHDLTFDPSTFNQQKSDPDAIRDFRTPRFDLDNLYGRGPGDQPFLYDGIKLALGEKLFLIQRNPKARDLMRAPAAFDGNQRAIIGDPRNDENVIVSQFHGMMQRFHNAMVDLNPKLSFAEIQLEVRRHYQWAVVHDFLPKIVRDDVLDAISAAIRDPARSFGSDPPRLRLYEFNRPIMPVEFSVAAYRLGHSMVRPGYRVNEFTAPIKIFDHDNPTMGLNAFGDFPKSWTIDWQRFIDLGMGPKPETDPDRVQLAYKIDTSLVEPLGDLPHSVAGDEADANPRLRSLAFRNMLRGQILRLPSGQDVADHIHAPRLDDGEIIIGPANDDSQETVPPDPDTTVIPITQISGVFKGKCPLWAYILAESRHNFYTRKRARLGAVGGAIVGEVFLALLNLDRFSIVNAPDWRPMEGNVSFGLADILEIALAG